MNIDTLKIHYTRLLLIDGMRFYTVIAYTNEFHVFEISVLMTYNISQFINNSFRKEMHQSLIN